MPIKERGTYIDPMQFQGNPEAIPFLFTSLFLAALSVYGWRNRHLPCGLPFAVMMIGPSIWSLGSGMELLCVDYPSKMAFLALSAFGASIPEPGALAFALAYCGQAGWINKRRIFLLSLEPVAVWLASASNPWHYEYWTHVTLVQSGPYLVTSLGHGSLFWIHVAYSYALILIVLYLLLKMWRVSHFYYRVQIAFLVGGILFPFVLNIAQVSGLPIAPDHLDFSVLGFSATGLAMLPALHRFGLLNVTPAAKDSVFQALRDSVIVLDNSRKVVDANPKGFQFFQESPFGLDCTKAFSFWPELVDKLELYQEGEWEISYPPTWPGEGKFDARLWSVTERKKNVGFVLTLRDVTARWLMARELSAAKDAAEEADRAKSAFLANMSHEIRTPLGAVLSYCEILLGQAVSPAENKEIIQAIRRNSRHLMQIIDDILDLSKIEAGKMDLEALEYSPWQVVLEAHSSLTVKAMEKNISLVVQANNPLPQLALFDPTRLRQILVNLLSNAIKFTHAGQQVTLLMSAKTEPEIKGAAQFTIKVMDQGIGMSKDQVNRLFQPFQQADSSTSRKFGGTGLGLSITNRLVRSMGGTIEIESEPGKGSNFTIQLRFPLPAKGTEWVFPDSLAIEKSKGTPTDTPHPDNLLKGRILLAEDHPDNQKILLHHLQCGGLEIVLANNGLEAMDKALSEEFDLILMDMQMPECDGYTATRTLRKKNYERPIIALTAHAMKEDRQKCLEAGCSDYIAKPVSARDLLETIRKYLNPKKAISPSAFTHPAASLSPAPEPATTIMPALLSGGGGTQPKETAIAVADETDDPDFQELVRDYALHLAEQASQLAAAHKEANLAQLKILSHKLKGSGGMFGFPEITANAANLEAHILGNSSAESTTQALEQLLFTLNSIHAKYRT